MLFGAACDPSRHLSSSLLTRFVRPIFALLPVVLAASAANAQGSWQIQMQTTGSRSGNSLNAAPPQVRAISSTTNPFLTQFQDGNAKINVSVRVRLVWSGTGQPTPAPKSVRIRSLAGAGCLGVGTQYVNNGIGSPTLSSGPSGQPPYPDATNSSSDGIKLFPVVGGGTGTTIDVATLDVKAELTGSGTATVRIEASPDNRFVEISSNIEPNFRRSDDPPGQGRPVQNVRNPDGSIVADCQSPKGWIQNFWLFPVTISYSGTASGFGLNSFYSWQASAGYIPVGSEGIFHPWPLFGVTATYGAPSITGGMTEIVTLKCIDGSDGAQASNTYTVRFRDEYDEPHLVTSESSRPRMPADQYLADGWVVALEQRNPSGQEIQSGSYNITDVKGWELTLGAESEVPPILAKIFSKVTTGAKMSSTTSQAVVLPGYPIPSGKRIVIYSATRRSTKSGTVSKWGYHGYIGDVVFSGTESLRVHSPALAPSRARLSQPA